MAKPMRKSELSIQDIGDETLLYSADNRAVHVLNPTAQLIWNLCDGNHTVEDIEQAIRANFSVPNDHDVAEDVRQTLEVFTAKELLQAAE